MHAAVFCLPAEIGVIAMETCNSKELRRKLKNSLKVIRKFDWLLDAYVLDFYVDNHWNKIPLSWRKQLEQVPPEYLAELLINDATEKKRSRVVWPLTLLALRECLKCFCISRQTIHTNTCINLSAEQDLKNNNDLAEHVKLKHLFTKCVKPKKRHEIDRMAAVCQRVYSQAPVDFLIDFGAGLGHLARVLGYGYGIRVCCLEMQDELNVQARLMDAQLETLATKHLSSLEVSRFRRPSHVTLRLSADMQPEKFLSMIVDALELSNNHNTFNFGIIGLHPCGDLGAILMRMFLHCPEAKFLNIVGCCYMKLSTTKSNSLNSSGYPLSRFLKQSLQLAHLSYEAREISCHASEMYSERLASGNCEHLKVHSYRAAAERILVKHWPGLKHCGLRSVKQIPKLQFEEYFYKAVQGLPAVHLPSTELRTPVTLADLEHWRRIVVFYTLRLMLAPLVESVILYDRMLYLMENDCQVEINAIFDPRLSPRNHVTTAIKHS